MQDILEDFNMNDEHSRHLLALSIDPVSVTACETCCNFMKDLNFWTGTQNSGRCREGCDTQSCDSSGFACRTGVNFLQGNDPEFHADGNGDITAYVCFEDGTVAKYNSLTSSPTLAETTAPTPFPTTSAPTKFPTPAPTKFPTKSPTTAPTPYPTAPTNSGSPTKFPTKSPTKFPTKAPSKAPTKSPTKFPTNAPSKTPTKFPTKAPSKSPTKFPTKAPTLFPTTGFPTVFPTTRLPTVFPTTGLPTIFPTESPTTTAPTLFPTAPTDPTPEPTREPTTEGFGRVEQPKIDIIMIVGIAAAGLCCLICVVIMVSCICASRVHTPEETRKMFKMNKDMEYKKTHVTKKKKTFKEHPYKKDLSAQGELVPFASQGAEIKYGDWKITKDVLNLHTGEGAETTNDSIARERYDFDRVIPPQYQNESNQERERNLAPEQKILKRPLTLTPRPVGRASFAEDNEVALIGFDDLKEYEDMSHIDIRQRLRPQQESSLPTKRKTKSSVFSTSGSRSSSDHTELETDLDTEFSKSVKDEDDDSDKHLSL